MYVVTPIPETPNTGFSFFGGKTGATRSRVTDQRQVVGDEAASVAQLTVSEEEQDVSGNVGVELPVQDRLKRLLGLGPPELWVLLLDYVCAVKQNVPGFKQEGQNARTRVEV